MPLALLALHALVARPRPRVGLALGACLAGQLLCSIYYGVFLALFARRRLDRAGGVAHGARPRLVAATAAAAIPLALVAVPYLCAVRRQPIRACPAHRRRGRRAQRHARPTTCASPVYNVLRGRNDGGPAPEERSLYPGAAAIGLALFGLWRPRSRTTWVYAGLAVVAFDASLGVHGLTFRVLQADRRRRSPTCAHRPASPASAW